MTREEAIKNINALNAVCGQKDFYDSEFEEALGMAVEALENQKTGHWEYVQYDSNPKIGNYHCSVCRHIIIPFENQKYCPNCGAKMEGNKE